MRRALTALFFLAGGTSTSFAQWSPETRLTLGGGSVYGEGISTVGTTVHVVYGTGDIRYRRSSDEGASWSTEAVIGSGTLHLTDPLAADGNDVWVVYLAALQNVSDWCCVRDMGTIWLRHSANGGNTWDAPVQLTTSSTAFRLSLAYAANRLHLVWMDYRRGEWDTYYLRSQDRGASWEPEALVAASTGPFGAERPQVAARGDSVHVTIWDDRANNAACTVANFAFPRCPDTFHIRSINGGQTWGAMTNVANGGTNFSGRNDIAVAGAAGVVINFNQDVAGETGSKLFAVASVDDGATWGTPVRLTFSANGSDHGSIIGYGDAVFLAWHDDRNPSNREVYYRRSPNGGLTWDAEEQVSPGLAGDSSTPLNAVTPNYAQVIWIDDRSSGYQVYHRRRLLTGAPIPDGGVPDATGPLAWWRLDEDSGTAAEDSTGNGHTGTVVGGAAWVAGRSGSALNLGGTQGHVAVAGFSAPASLTLQAWVNAQANTGNDSIILNTSNAEYDFRLDGNGRLTGTAGGTSLGDVSFDFYAAGNAGMWHHVAYTFDDAANTHQLYVDGVLVASGTNASTIQATGNDLWIGRHRQFDFATFQGILDDVKIFPRALSAEEVFFEFGGGPVSSSSSLAAGSSGEPSSGTSAAVVSSGSSATSGVSLSASSAGVSTSLMVSSGSAATSAGLVGSGASSGNGIVPSSASQPGAGVSSSTGGGGPDDDGGCACGAADGATGNSGVGAVVALLVVVRVTRRPARGALRGAGGGAMKGRR